MNDLTVWRPVLIVRVPAADLLVLGECPHALEVVPLEDPGAASAQDGLQIVVVVVV